MNSIETKIQPQSEYELRLDEIEAVMEQSPEQQKEFIQKTIEKFDSESPVKGVSIIWNNFAEGPLNSKSEVKRTMLLDGFYVNDPALYEEFINCLKIFKDDPAMEWSKNGIRTFIPTAIQFAINRYFGNRVDNAEAKNREIYESNSSFDSNPMDISIFKGKGVAVCAEKASAAQNLNSFAGIKSYMIASVKSQLHGEEGPTEMHMYNIIQTDRGYFLFDPTNLTSTVDKNSQANSWKPSIYPLTEEEFKNLSEGQSVTVTHTDNYYKDGELHTETTMRIFGGPKKQ